MFGPDRVLRRLAVAVAGSALATGAAVATAGAAHATGTQGMTTSPDAHRHDDFADGHRFADEFAWLKEPDADTFRRYPPAGGLDFGAGRVYDAFDTGYYLTDYFPTYPPA